MSKWNPRSKVKSLQFKKQSNSYLQTTQKPYLDMNKYKAINNPNYIVTMWEENINKKIYNVKNKFWKDAFWAWCVF